MTVSVKRTSREKSAWLPTAIWRARQPQLFAAIAVEQRELADGGDLVEQLGVVGAVLFQLSASEARVTQLIWRSRSEIDCSIRFAVASAFSPMPSVSVVRVAAVADPGLDRAVHGQHEHHQAHQRDDVFGEQAFAEKPDLVLDADHPDPRALNPNG